MHVSLPTRILAVTLALAASTVAAHEFDDESAQIAELIGLRSGMTVADIGAGDGRFGEWLAGQVGETGRVSLTEVGEAELETLRQLREESGLTEIQVVTGSEDDTNLADACCDALLVRYVVHHMSDRESMFASLRRTLRGDGRILIIEKVDPGDGIDSEVLVEEMIDAGFLVISQHPEWGDHDGHYGVLFRAAGTDVTSGSE